MFECRLWVWNVFWPRGDRLKLIMNLIFFFFLFYYSFSVFQAYATIPGFKSCVRWRLSTITTKLATWYSKYTLRTCAGPPLNIQCHLLNLPPYYQTRAKLGAALQTAMSFSDSVTFFLPSPYSATKPNFFGMVHPVIKWSIQYSYLITRLMHALCLFLKSNWTLNKL